MDSDKCPCCDRTDGTHTGACGNQNPYAAGYGQAGYGLAQIKKEGTSVSYDGPNSDNGGERPETRWLEIPLTEREWTDLYEVLMSNYRWLSADQLVRYRKLGKAIGTWENYCNSNT